MLIDVIDCNNMIMNLSDTACKNNLLWVNFFIVGFLLSFMSKYVFNINRYLDDEIQLSPKNITEIYEFMRITGVIFNIFGIVFYFLVLSGVY